MGKHIDLWLEGWRRGDAAMVMSSVSDDFVHDDPVDGRFTQAQFAANVEELLATECTPEGFETITDVVTFEQDGVETTLGWWTTLRVPLEGAGMLRARADGVYLERVAYSTRPGE